MEELTKIKNENQALKQKATEFSSIPRKENSANSKYMELQKKAKEIDADFVAAKKKVYEQSSEMKKALHVLKRELGDNTEYMNVRCCATMIKIAVRSKFRLERQK